MRTVQEWRDIVNDGKSSTELARFVLSDLAHYQSGRMYEWEEDVKSLSNLLYSLFEDCVKAEERRGHRRKENE